MTENEEKEKAKSAEPEPPVQEKKTEAKPQEAQEKKSEKKAEAAAEAPKEQARKKIRKISGMTLPEVEAELKTVKEKMGGFQSAFAQHLLARKKELTSK